VNQMHRRQPEGQHQNEQCWHQIMGALSGTLCLQKMREEKPQKTQRLPVFAASWFNTEKLEDYWYGYSPNGYNHAVITLDYLVNIFEPATNISL
jgi:hypothetical protein